MVGSIILSCNPIEEQFKDLPPFTFAPTIKNNCDQVTPLVGPNTKKPKVIYALIDRSGSFGSLTEKSIDVLIGALEKSIEPGDRLHLVWLGAKEDTSKFLLVESVPTIKNPILIEPIATFAPTSTPTPTFTPSSTPTPYKTFSVLELQEQSQTATIVSSELTITANNVSIAATNTAIFVENNLKLQHCNQIEINQKNQNSLDDWHEQKHQISKEFIKNFFNPVKEDHYRGDDNKTRIFNALFYAAKTIRQEKETQSFDNYYLIILSDMEDVGSKDGESLNIDLSGVHVLIAMVYCENSIDCQKRENYWIPYLKEHGALLPTYPFWLVNETTSTLISDFFEISGGN